MTDNGNAEPIGAIYEALTSFFKADEWEVEQVEERPILRMTFEGENGSWDCFAQAREDTKQCVFFSSLGAFVPDDKRMLAAEFFCRANYGMIIGNFEMDFDDGEVRFRTSVDVESSELTQIMIKNLVYTNVLVMDKYLPGLKSIISDSVSPEDAILKIEDEETAE